MRTVPMGGRRLTVRAQAAAAVAMVLALSSLARAERPEDVATARRLAIEGIELADAGDCVRALPLLARAEELHHAPVHLRWRARCDETMGRLVEAAETWRKLAAERPAGDVPDVVRAAIAEAKLQLPRIEARLGAVVVTVTGGVSDVRVELDGDRMAPASVGVARVVDPGVHRWAARAPGYRRAEGTLSVAEGETASLSIELTAEPASAPTETWMARASGLRTAGYVMTIGGAALLTAGGVTWLARNSARADILRDCPDLACSSDHGQERTHVERLTAATNVLVVGGVAALAGGLTMIVLGRQSHAQVTAGTDGVRVSGSYRF